MFQFVLAALNFFQFFSAEFSFFRVGIWFDVFTEKNNTL